MNFPPLLINLLSFLNISFLKFQAPKNTYLILFNEFFVYFFTFMFVPGINLFFFSGVVSKKYLISFLVNSQ